MNHQDIRRLINTTDIVSDEVIYFVHFGFVGVTRITELEQSEEFGQIRVRRWQEITHFEFSNIISSLRILPCSFFLTEKEALEEFTIIKLKSR